MYKLLSLITITIFSISSTDKSHSELNYAKSLANYDDFKTLVNEVEHHRAKHLISLDQFNKMSKHDDVVILDTRSKFRYDRKHIKGAIHLDFSDFTQNELNQLIPNPNTKILIYCNNNFIGDQIDFTSKIANPAPKVGLNTINKPSYLMALNIPNPHPSLVRPETFTAFKTLTVDGMFASSSVVVSISA